MLKLPWKLVVLTGIKHLFDSALVHQGFRRYFANTSWMLAEQILRLVAGLFVGIYVARYLGPEQFGIYSYAAAFVALFGAIARLGLDGIVVRDLVNHPEERDIYLGTAFWLKLTGSLLTLSMLAIAVQLTGNNARTNLYIFIIGSGLIFQSFDVVDFYFQSKVLSKYVSICRVVQLALSSVLKLYFIFIQADLFWFVLVSLVDQISLALSLVFAYQQQKIGRFFGRFNLGAAKAMLRNSWPLILSGIAISVYMRIDQIMIKEMLGEREVGLYSVAVRLSEVWYFVPMIIAASLFPAIVSAKKASESLYYTRLQKLNDLMVLLALSVAIPVTFLSDWVVALLYGSAYAQAGAVLAIHIWTGVLVFLGVVNGQFLLIEGLMKTSFYFTLFCSALNVMFNLFLIPKYGILGAAIATLLAQCIGIFFSFLYKPTRAAFYMQIRALLMLNILKGNFR